MEFAIHITTSLSGRRREAVPPSQAASAVDPKAPCWWCGLEVDPRWPAAHPAAPLVVATPARSGGDAAGTWPEHRFCADPVNRGFDVKDPDASVPVRRARLAFAVRLAGAGDLAQAREWRRFQRGGDPERTTVAHLRSMLRLGVRPRAADVAAVVCGPLTRRLYLARMRKWSRRAEPTPPAGR
ncbi:hypothetical protein [Saccharothrix sp. ALI-22-I]|uniref:hypothetical protein n=1 Tax=Saccharothrix sp. ALI-22-I TaxID=1933778 RepID=UPI00097CA488|nr:hypothetical protein [Saccharothrix sp. ALI-22-I]